jgi:hypothetical protein
MRDRMVIAVLTALALAATFVELGIQLSGH